ncbi:MAG: hypothetical protein A3G20_06250 [Acidobacteria bacterium RIFCSPLOWO2_12_FULL_59_11]|nr:MAG: hypothetical protein A3G20_06250 [Acidobacteria bacterium RIFCSPLOWO2_12_FULL_59_11]
MLEAAQPEREVFQTHPDEGNEAPQDESMEHPDNGTVADNPVLKENFQKDSPEPLAGESHWHMKKLKSLYTQPPENRTTEISNTGNGKDNEQNLRDTPMKRKSGQRKSGKNYHQ